MPENDEELTLFLILRKGKEPGTLCLEAQPEVLLRILDDACENPLMHVKRNILTDREREAKVRGRVYTQFAEIIEATELDEEKGVEQCRA